MLNDIDKSIFMIIDIQEKLINASFNKDSILKKSKILSNVAKILNIPTIITEQYPQGLGSTINEIKEFCTENYFEKITFNAIENKELLEKLKLYNKKQIILLGIETHICVYQTAVSLLQNGFDVYVIKDACGSRNIEEHNNALNLLENYGAKIKTTEMLIFEFLRSAKHPKFKDIQNLIK